jgi:aconitate hydratase
VNGATRESLGLTGEETYAIAGTAAKLEPGMTVKVTADNGPRIDPVSGLAVRNERDTKQFDALVRIDTPDEADYYRHGGILQYVLRSLATA